MIDEEILHILREHPGVFLSGEEISRRLKVTRTTVWKRIKQLRTVGYEVEASTRSGYRLTKSPDLLTPLEVKPLLKTEWMGRSIHHFFTLDSTNTKAYELGSQGAKEGEVILAESQEQGRGRLGRKWLSPSFLNLYLSVILRPPIPPYQAPLITLMAAVATFDAIQTFSGLDPLIKWPNDILLKGKKVAGLLNEIKSESDRIHFVILGLGVNLNMGVEMFPREIRPIATSLKIEMKETVSRKAFLQSLLMELETWYLIFLKEGGPPILKAWRERARLEGRRVKVSSFGEPMEGIAVDVDSDGALILEMAKGIRKKVIAGDVEYQQK